MREEVLDGNLYENSGRLDREEALAIHFQAATRLRKNPTTYLAGDPRVNVQRVGDRDGPFEFDRQTGRDRWDTQQPIQTAQYLVECGAKYTTVSQAGRTLMMLAYSKVTVHGHSCSSDDAQMQTCCVIDAAAEAPSVMRRDFHAGVRRTDGPGWYFRTLRCVGPAHGRAHYPVRHTGQVRERLVPPWWIFAVAMILPAMVAIAYGAALNWWIGVVLFVIGTAAVGTVLWRTAPVVVVDADGGLQVARAYLPRQAQGAVQTVNLADVNDLLRGDARAFTALRSWYSRQAVVVDVTDPADPHTRWIFSVRDPQGFVLALAPR